MQQMRRTYRVHQATHFRLDEKVRLVMLYRFNAVEDVSPPDRMDFITVGEQSGNRVTPDES